MTTSLEVEAEVRQQARALRLFRILDGGLEAAVGRAGGELTGFSAKMSGVDTLLTLRAVFPGGKMIAFAGGLTLGAALEKAYREAKTDALRWRPDKWD